MGYKWCVVPRCASTSIKTPEKLFVPVPQDPNKRKIWLSIAHRDPKSIGPNSSVYMCEDHFDMEKDVANYMKVKMGFSNKVVRVDGALPSKFDCHKDLKRQLSNVVREVFVKKQKQQQELVEKCKQENIPHCTESPRTQDKATNTEFIVYNKETMTDSMRTAVKSVQITMKKNVHYRSKCIQTNFKSETVSTSPFQVSSLSRFTSPFKTNLYHPQPSTSGVTKRLKRTLSLD